MSMPALTDARADLEQLARKMRNRARPCRSEGQAAGLRLGERDQFVHRGDAERRMRHQQVRQLVEQADRREVLHRIERQVAIQRRPHAMRADGAEKQRVPVGRRLGRGLGANAPAGAGTVIDQHLLAEALADELADAACQHIGRAAGGEGDDQPQRLGGIRLRECGDREGKGKREDRETDHAGIVNSPLFKFRSNEWRT
jgi:hypothetical protein